jgi:hypothetical protein
LMAEGGLYAMTACSPGLLRHSGGLSRSRRGKPSDFDTLIYLARTAELKIPSLFPSRCFY